LEFFVFFSRPNDTEENQPPIDPVRFGPFSEFMQLTYNELRSGPDGDFIAYIDPDGVWRIHDDRSATDKDYWYSDLVITNQAS
jgi:hypothetical protein